MATDLIRYDLLVQNAFRDVFRKVMADVAAKGLPGEHHFLVTFRTGAPGVKISDRLRQAHPQDMTIVLQHQFWDFTVTDTGFSVGLSFKNVPEKLVVPFAAVTGFFDPSVNFGAEFTVEGSDSPAEPKLVPDKPLALATSKGRATRGSASEPAELSAKDAVEGPKPGRKEPAPVAPLVSAKGPAEKGPVERGSASKAAEKGEDATPASSEGSKVVSIDAFRKKT